MKFKHTRHDVYLANALFSEAERAFNTHIAQELGNNGLTVFLPQESNENCVGEPTPLNIFLSDTREVVNSKVVLAVLDGETIDSGVACEIGIAMAHGVPIVGLWTDLRRKRTGEGCKYHNIFVLGAVKHNGVITSSVREAVDFCREIVLRISAKKTDERIIEHYKEARNKTNDILRWIPQAYSPPLDVGEEISKLIRRTGIAPQSVLDVGSGNQWLKSVIHSSWPNAEYVPYDPAWEEPTHSPKSMPPESVEIAIIAFCLHDISDQENFITTVSRYIKSGGHIIILDLSDEDLAGITSKLREDFLLTGSDKDSRLSPEKVLTFTRKSSLDIASMEVITRRFVFSTKTELQNYFSAFGIDKGFDFPWLPEVDFSSALLKVADSFEFPLTENRIFLACLLTKHSVSL